MKTPPDHLIKDLEEVSNLISSRVRSLMLGVIAVVWALVVAADDAFQISAHLEKQLFICGGIAVLAMCIDYVQYVFGYSMTRQVLAQFEAGKNQDGVYDYSDWRYRGRVIAFWAKQLVALAAIACLAVSIIDMVALPDRTIPTESPDSVSPGVRS